MAKRKFNEKKHSHHRVTTFQLIKRWLDSRIPTPKELPLNPDEVLLRQSPHNKHVHHLAIVLDGEVQEVIRADSTMAALFLSEPKIVEFNPLIENVTIGTKYEDGKLLSEPRQPVQGIDHIHG